MLKRGVLACGLVVMLGSIANAQDLGAIEYSNSCAVCHGQDGKGDGPVSSQLLNTPPDLTVLSKMNGGVFPIADVYAIIDGTADVAVHGGRDMPIWGDRYMTEMQDDPTAHYSWAEARAYALNRVLALVEYLSSIQE